jgi:gliding motility-associated-like protein
LRYLLITVLAIFCFPAFASHNRAGEITYQQIGPLTIRMTVTTYTKDSSKGADRDSLEIFWGDGLSEWVKRVNGSGKGVTLENDVKLNKYTADHTYPGRSSYTVSFLDPNRSANILNINYPRSEDIKFYLSTKLTLLDLQFQGRNNSAELLQPPIDIACVGQPFIHNPNAYDPDGDSLSYELIIPLQADGENVPNYLFPDQILPGPTNLIFLNKLTGDFIWRNPPQVGEYNIAMRINEWREGVLINSIVRDMQILVKDCKSRPPVIDMVQEICVIAGTEINIPIAVSDPDINQKVKLTVSGGPLNFATDKAELIAPPDFTKVPYSASLQWKTTCNHIAKEYYQIIVRAVDNSIGDTFGLATLKTIKIKVVGPPPQNVTAKAENDSGIKVEWQSPYDCEVTNNDYFFGFSVWRKTQSIDLPVDTCNLTSLRNIYTRIVFNTKQQANGKYFIVDNDVKPNVTYCYRVIGEFALETASGNPFKKVESIYSDEVCIQLKRDIPLLTKVSVSNTGDTNGNMELKWTKPLIIDFDTLKFPAPYKTELYSSLAGANQFTLIPGATKIGNTFSTWFDTTYTHSNINTANQRYDYQLKFYYSNDKEYKPVPNASSVYLTIESSDKQNKLTFNYATPWANKNFEVFRKDANGVFQLIGKSTSNTYVDLNLINEENYCYKVKSLGTYSIPFIENPLINFSQEACSKPVDNVPPCPPILNVKTICDEEVLQGEEVKNELKWTLDLSCTNIESPTSFNIYYKPTVDDQPILLQSQSSNLTFHFFHQPDTNDIAGCYTITAVDQNGNESIMSNEVCIDNCPVYDLPNTFTPNKDGTNDIYKPIKNFFISKVDFKVFNEWGNKVFETDNPSLNWDGNLTNGRPVADGTYYYTCITFVRLSSGIQSDKVLKGYINVIR